MNRREFNRLAVTATVAAASGIGLPTIFGSKTAHAQDVQPEPPPPSQPSGPPNIYVLMLDDATLNQADVAMPNLHGIMTADPHWTDMRNAYSNAPICGPSRACILTGRYVQQHGVLANRKASAFNTYLNNNIGTWMAEQNAYRCYNFGKVLHGKYHPKSMEGWTLARGSTIELLDSIKDSDRPFFIFDNDTDPHRPYTPDSGDKNTEIPGIPVWRRDIDRSGQPKWVQKLRAAPGGAQKKFKGAYLEMLRADRYVQTLYDKLRHIGKLDNTIFIITSDHGYQIELYNGKNGPYEQDTKIPMFIRNPYTRQEESRQAWQLVDQVDLTAALLDFAETTPQLEPMGRSFRPMTEGTDIFDWEDFVYIYGWADDRRKSGEFYAARMGADLLYVENRTLPKRDEEPVIEIELYDVSGAEGTDQYVNLAARPEYASVRANMAERLALELAR